MVRASLWIFNDWDSDIEESIENAGGIFLLSKKCEVKNLGNILYFRFVWGERPFSTS